MSKKEKVQQILKRLSIEWPNPKTELNFTTPLEILIATILSAQTTDKVVNSVTPELFATYTNVVEFADASEDQIHAMIRKVNYAHTKAKNIKKLAQILIDKYTGVVPDSMEDLISLPGVARKTANVVLGNAFGKNEGIAVDTHIIRLSPLLGLTTEKKPEKIEQDLMNIVPKKDWTKFSHLLILYGRYKCSARMDVKACPILTDLFV